MDKRHSKLRCVLDNGVILPKMYQWDDAISVFCRKENFAFMSDRFGYLNQFSRIDAAAISEGKLPSGSYTKSFSDIMKERAYAISHSCTANGLDCVVLWSGGCDSTAILSAFFSVCSDLSFIKVLHTKTSIIENPDFYNFLQKNNVRLQMESIRQIFRVGLDYAKKGHIVVYGFPADQLFGSVLGQTYKGDTTIDRWEDFLKVDKATQQYEAAFKHYGLPIKTVAEFFWFNNFALKWDYVCNWTACVEHETHHNIINFYNHYDFECWSISNFDILHKYDQKDIKNYKIAMKDFIYRITGLSSVYNMRKVPSIAYAENTESEYASASMGISAIDDSGCLHTVLFDRKRCNDGGLYAASLMRKFLKK